MSLNLQNIDNGQVDGWGPDLESSGFSIVEGLPFFPFSKTEKIYKIADVSSTSKYSKNMGYDLPSQKEDGSFSTISMKVKGRKKTLKPQRRYKNYNSNYKKKNYNNNRKGTFNKYNISNKAQRNNYWKRNRWNYDRLLETRQPSVGIQEDWKILEEWEFNEIAREVVKLDKVESTDITTAGEIGTFNGKLSLLTTKSINNHLTMKKNIKFPKDTRTEDSIMKKIVADTKNDKTTVFGTSYLFAVLMTHATSVISWDILIRKEGKKIFLDRREKSKIEQQTVNENWNEILVQDEDSINHFSNLCEEATTINQKITQYTINKKVNPLELEQKTPLKSDGTSPTIGLTYRKVSLDEDLDIVTRGEIHGYIGSKNEPDFYQVRAFNEFDSKLSGDVDWRSILESQPGAVFATEKQNNLNKINRWVAEAALADVNKFVLAYVSREHANTTKQHRVLKTQKYNSSQFAGQANCRISNLWDVLAMVLHKLEPLADGHYCLVRHPSKPQMTLYDLPKDGYTSLE